MHGDGPAHTTRTCDGQKSPLSKCRSPPVDGFHADGTKGCQMTTALEGTVANCEFAATERPRAVLAIT
jgi:hypothetical protein